MTREEIINNLYVISVAFVDPVTKEQRKIIDDTFGAAIKALEQEPILDKIRAEIESCREDEEPHLCDYRYHRNEGLDKALDIIDKYNAESEE